MSLVDIIRRIPDSHPGPEEAWGCVSRGLNDEGPTLIYTEQMREAFSSALQLSDDPIAARMLFKEVYTRLIGEAMARGNVSPRWVASLGWDKSGRELALLDAVEKGRLGAKHVIENLLPHHCDHEELMKRLRLADKTLAAPEQATAIEGEAVRDVATIASGSLKRLGSPK